MSNKGDLGIGLPEVIATRELAKRRSGGGQPNGGGSMGAIFSIFPLVSIPIIIYNLIAFGGAASGNSDWVRDRMSETAMTIPMASGVEWSVAWADLFVIFSLVLLFIELLKSTSTGASAIFNHALSMLVFIICLIEFLLHPAFATSVFFILLVMALLDVLAGVVVTIISARRDVALGEQFQGR